MPRTAKAYYDMEQCELPSVRWQLRNIDEALFYSLFFFVLLYQLQKIFHWIADYKVRELLYIALYFRVLLCYRTRINLHILLIYVFLSYSAFVSFHTFLIYGRELALHGLFRFINVALLAPLAAVFINDYRKLRLCLYLWMAVVVLGSLTLIYQVLGGDIPWLAREDYLVLREGKVRFMTLLGEPNVGGRSSAILIALSVMFFRSKLIRFVALFLAFVLLVLSLSRAGLAGFLLSIPLVFIAKRKSFTINRAVTAVFTSIAFALVLAILLTANPLASEVLGEYGTTFIDSFIGQQDVWDSAIGKDLQWRLYDNVLDGLEFAKDRSDLYFLNFLCGSSFGIAGSAAEELLGATYALVPHNSIAEVYFVGGIIHLLLFFAIILITLMRFWNQRHWDETQQTLLVSFLMILANVPTYPLITQPVLGGLFWLMVGIGASRSAHLNCFWVGLGHRWDTGDLGVAKSQHRPPS